MKLFNRHYGTERFFIMIFACMAILIAFGIYGGVVQYENEKNFIAETAVYTDTYTWSKLYDEDGSGNGYVVGLITNNDNTSAFLLLGNNGRVVSSNADEYRVYLSGRDKKLTGNYSMTTYVYGTTGYVGFYFRHPEGFSNQIYSVIVRNTSSAAEAAGDSKLDPNRDPDQSFTDHNQIRLLLNFGASGVAKSDIMDAIEIDSSGAPLKLMSAMPVAVAGSDTGHDYERLQREAQNLLEKMSRSLITIRQYGENLTDQGVIVPDLPYYMKDDFINTVPNDFTKEPTIFDPNMCGSALSTGSGTDIIGTGQTIVDPTPKQTDRPDSEVQAEIDAMRADEGTVFEGAKFEQYNDNDELIEVPYYYLHTQYLYPGTVNFEWQGRPLSSGLITQIDTLSDDKTNTVPLMYDKFVDWRDESSQYSDKMANSISYDLWRKATGDSVDMSVAENVNTSEARLAALCRDYLKSINEYLSLKGDFAYKLSDMLVIENNVWALGQDMSSNDGSTAKNLWVY